MVTSGRYPTLYLSKSGVKVMRGEQPVTLFSLPASPKPARRRRSAAAREEDPDAPPVNEDLFEALRELRRQLASERGVPPYLIFNDRTLLAFASYRPSTKIQLLEIKGVGEKKAADLGELFLQRIAEFAES